MLLKYLLCILIIVSQVISDKNQNQEENVFVPTREWQVVKKGQQIPKGLHVRVNFETGVTEAKILDETEKTSENNALLHIPQEDDKDENKKLLKTDTIKETLKKIKGDDILNIENIKKIKDKFRSYEDLKKEINDLNLTPKIDAEILKDLFKEFKDEMKNDKMNVKSISKILEDLDFLAHQFDNGLEFVRQNGFNEIIYKNLNSSDNQIKQDTLKLFGSLVQNNGKVQIHALETGSIGVLLRILNVEQSVDVKSRAIYALSCLLRRFPLAQLRFIENGGIPVVIKILETDPTIKIQIKLITLMNDLLTESIHALLDKTENQIMLYSQYQLVNLEKHLLEHGWCKHLNKLLYSLIVADPDDHDSIEKCISAMHTVADKCAGQYTNDILIRLQERYKILALSELSSNDYFRNLLNLCKDIMLQQKNIKTEL